MYDVGELSMIMVSRRSRPTWDKSYCSLVTRTIEALRPTHLDIVPLVVVAAFPEQAMVHNVVYIELVKKWITVLQPAVSEILSTASETRLQPLTQKQ